MKPIVMCLLNGILLLTACAPSGTATPFITIQGATETPSSTPTNTSTSIPTETSTVTITPLPAIPTFTPRFDASTIVTVTPAPKAECPKETPDLIADFPIRDLEKCNSGDSGSCYVLGTANQIQSFLNSGGSISAVTKRLEKADERTDSSHLHLDVTNDSVPEFMFHDFGVFTGFHILSCQRGQYEAFQVLADPPVYLYSIEDLNQNGIPELILTHGWCSGSGCIGIVVLEWDGNTYKNLSEQPIVISGPKSFDIKDFNKDGHKDIVLTGEQPGSCCMDLMTPWRYKTIVYSWNRKMYSEAYVSFDKARYRFQAIQDADREISHGNYDPALTYYQDAIFSDKLAWWSKDRRDYEVKLLNDSYKLVTPTPLPYPKEDNSEYPRLAAYAYYRIMLLHVVQGNQTDATATYNTLQEKFGNDQYSRPYVVMATEFWNAYQSTHKMYDGCAAAIQYASERPEILIPLGSDYHGWQSHTYVPADVCPFR